MADLVPKMAEQGSVRFAQVDSALLAGRIVGLGDRQRDDAVGVPGHHRDDASVRADFVREKVESEAGFGVLGFVGYRQMPGEKRVEQLALG